MTILPTGSRIYLGLKPIQKVGDLDVSSKKTVQEWGVITAKGPECTSKVVIDGEAVYLKVGDTIMFKAWALDSITYEKEEYFFVDEKSGGICAVIQA